MNSTKSKRRLAEAIESEYSPSYRDDADVEDGDEILVYGRRVDRGNRVEWKVQEIIPAEEEFCIGVNVEEQKGNHQLLIRGTLHLDGRRGHTFKNAEIIEESPIDKCKDEIKHYLVQLWRTGWSKKYLNGLNVFDLDSDSESFAEVSLEPIQESDFKVTTVRSREKSMHMGNAPFDADYRFKLGVKWSSWHRMSPTQRVHILTHELTHCLHQNHKRMFFIEHAKFVASIAETGARRRRVEHLFGEVNWNKLKSLTMKGAHRQAQEIDISGYQHRRAAVNALIEEKLEPILDYSYEVGMMFHLHPPADETFPSWDANNEPDNVEYRQPMSLDVDETYSDEELFEHMNETLPVEDDKGVTRLRYNIEDVPIVVEGQVIENKRFAAAFQRMAEDEMKMRSIPVLMD